MSEVDRASLAGPAAPTPGVAASSAREAVVSGLEVCDGALAAWEAGSAAFGRADELSDLDAGVLCAPGAGSDVLDAVEQSLQAALGEMVAYDVGRSLFGVQRFWRTPIGTDSARACMVDVSVMELDGEVDLWRELLSPERHGRALPMYDPEGVLADCIARSGLDLAAHRHRIAAELRTIAVRRHMFADFPTKELARGRTLDADAMFNAMVATPIIALLGMRYRPLRFDFGRRYLHEELPEPVVERLAGILRQAPVDLEAASATGLAWIDELLESIVLDDLPIEQHAAQMRAAFG